jgi:hypothetical protein
MDIVRVVVWVGLYFLSMGMLAVVGMSLVYMLGKMAFLTDITDSEPERWEDDDL